MPPSELELALSTAEFCGYPPPGTCLVHQATGDTSDEWELRGALPASASLSPQPVSTLPDGRCIHLTQTRVLSSALGGITNSTAEGMPLLAADGGFTVDPGGPNQTVLAVKLAPPPRLDEAQCRYCRSAKRAARADIHSWGQRRAHRDYDVSYAAATNSTVEVQCLAAPGATAFTIAADNLSNLPPTYGIRDGSYATYWWEH